MIRSILLAATLFSLALTPSCTPARKGKAELEFAGAHGSDGRYQSTYQRLADSEKLHSRKPEAALEGYLEIIREVFSDATGGEPGALSIYNRAAAGASELAFASKGHAPDGVSDRGQAGRWRIQLEIPDIGTGPLQEITSLQNSHSIKVPRGPKEIRHSAVRGGFGGTLVAHQLPTLESIAINPFLPTIGRYIPVSSVIDFPEPNLARIRLYDASATERVRLGGKTVPLAADFTAPSHQMMGAVPASNIGFKAMCHPEEYLKDTGIFMPEPYRPGKIPVIMVHGLKDDPTTWRNTYNELIADPEIRNNFQFCFFRYPTGLPLLYSSTLLRKHLEKFHAWTAEHGGGSEIGQMVLVGHSMGGILCNIQIRDGGDEFRKRILAKEVGELGLDQEDLGAIEDLILISPAPFVTRAILISAPHRGSKQATGIIGTLGNLLIDLTKNVTTLSFLRLKRPPHEGCFTELGRLIILGRADGVRSLRPDNPALREIAKLPVADSIAFHTIIGNQGEYEASPQDSTDGVVEYKSAHLRDADSEKIIPSDHLAHDAPEGIAEIRRILHLHLSNVR